MKYYSNAHERILEASRREPENQCLFLVADEQNPFDKNAVMLHDGVQKLGHIAAAECKEVRQYLQQESISHGQDMVLVVHVPLIKTDNFHWSTSLNVKVVGIVYERVARKFAQSFLKKES